MATDAIFKHLKLQNRPYSINDIVSNLKNEYGKTAVQNAVDKLVADGKVFEKVYGKQKIYCVVQDNKHDAEELMRIDKELQAHANEVEIKLQETEKEIKEQEALLSSLKSFVSLEEAKRERDKLKESVKVLTRKLDDFMDSNVNVEELNKSKKRAQDDLEKYTKSYAKRKKLCSEIISCILENYPGTKEQLYGEIGIEPTVI